MTVLRVALGLFEIGLIIVCVPVFAAADTHHPWPRRLALAMLVVVLLHRCLMPL